MNPLILRWTVEDLGDGGVQQIASMVQGGVLKGPLVVEVEVTEPRPSYHFGKGGREGILKESAPAYPSGKRLALDMAFDFADRCSGAVWEEGAVVALLVSGRFATPESGRRQLRMTIRRPPVETVGELVRRAWMEPPKIGLEFTL